MAQRFSGSGNHFWTTARTCRGRGCGRWSFSIPGSTHITSVFRTAQIRRLVTPLSVVAALLAVSAPLYFARGIGIFDDSLYLKIGQLIVDGFKPYRDFYDTKPPSL